jgi:hypothetical protein
MTPEKQDSHRIYRAMADHETPDNDCWYPQSLGCSTKGILGMSSTFDYGHLPISTQQNYSG